MSIYICRRTLISLSTKTYSHLYKPYISFPLSLFSSSSSSTTERNHPERPNAVADYLLQRHQFSPEAASKVSLLVKGLKRPEKIDSVISFLKESGFPQNHIELLVQRVPQVLSANLDRTIKPKFKVFLDLGFAPNDVLEIMMGDPWILTRSADNRVSPSILALKSVLGSNVDVARVLKISGWFLKHDLEKTMMPNIEFMKSCGINLSQITGFVYNFPRFFLHKTENIREFVRRVDDLGFDRKSKMLIHAIRVVSSMTVENWELKCELFRSLGFSEDDILSVFRRVPQVFAISGRKLKEGTEIFLSLGRFDISYLVDHPELLICSIENRLKPRLRVVEVLEKNNLLRKKPSMTTVCKMSDKKFQERYVLPYLNELGKEYLPKKGLQAEDVCAISGVVSYQK